MRVSLHRWFPPGTTSRSTFPAIFSAAFFGPHSPPEFSVHFEERVVSYLFERRLLPFVEDDIPKPTTSIISRMITHVLTATLAGWFIDTPEKSYEEIADTYLSFITSGIAGFLPEEKVKALQSVVHS